MVDMKMGKEKEVDIEDVIEESMKEPEYPYGLVLRLGEDCIEKLGVDVSEFKVGSTVKIMAESSVNMLSKSGECCSMELQITKLALASDESFEAAFEK